MSKGHNPFTGHLPFPEMQEPPRLAACRLMTGCWWSVKRQQVAPAACLGPTPMNPSSQLGRSWGCTTSGCLSSMWWPVTPSHMHPSVLMDWILQLLAPGAWGCTAAAATGGASLGMSARKGRSWCRCDQTNSFVLVVLLACLSVCPSCFEKLSNICWVCS